MTCACGCGQSATKTFIRGHNNFLRIGAPLETRYSEQDRGYETPCWIWTGSTIRSGYGRLMYRGEQVLAHRRYYEHHVGPIPEGLTIDHLCRVRACVNPDHLEPVTNAENVRRGGIANRKASVEELSDLRTQGLTLREVGERVGLSESRVCTLLKEAVLFGQIEEVSK